MFGGLIEGRMANAISDCVPIADITEIRIRAGRPLVVMTARDKKTAKSFGVPYIVSSSDIERVLSVASNYSVYSVNDEIVKGYIPANGVRIGVAGEGVSDGNRMVTVKHIKYVVIRVPHEIKGVADKLKKFIFTDDNEIMNTLVISPPGAGKTTLLRELARIASLKFNTLIIDERYEFAFSSEGNPTLDVGDCDVVSGVSKTLAYQNCIRAMNPEIIVTDELFSAAEAAAVEDIVRSGVKVFASVHGENVAGVIKSEIFKKLGDVFDLFVTLTKDPQIGTVSEIIKKSDIKNTEKKPIISLKIENRAAKPI